MKGAVAGGEEKKDIEEEEKNYINVEEDAGVAEIERGEWRRVSSESPWHAAG